MLTRRAMDSNSRDLLQNRATCLCQSRTMSYSVKKNTEKVPLYVHHATTEWA